MSKKSLLLMLSIFILSFGTLVRAQRRAAFGNPSPVKSEVELADAAAFSEGKGVWLRWQSAVETNNLGFNVYRLENGNAVQVNSFLIGGAPITAQLQANSGGGSYTFFDPAGDLSAIYYIESVGISGRRQTFAGFNVNYTADLTALAGNSAEFMRRAAAEAGFDVRRESLDLPKDLQKEISQGANFAAPDAPAQTAQQWVAAQPGVKIGVKQEGFYRVTRAELAAAGFDLTAPGSRWQLYLKGVEQAIIVGANDAYLEFYGHGQDTNESDTLTYYLINGAQNGKRIDDVYRLGIGGNVTDRNYNVSFLKKERSFYVSDYLNGDTDNFYGSIINPTSGMVTFNLSGVDLSAPTAQIKISLLGYTYLPHQVRILLNDTELGTVSGDGRVPIEGTYNVPTALLQNGTNTLKFNTLAGASDLALFDQVEINYARQFIADQNQISFYTDTNRAATLTGFTSANVRVFDITYPNDLQRVANATATANGATYNVRLAANRARVMFAVADEALKTAASVTQNFPSTLSSSANGADLLIVSYRDLLPQANDWAAYRRTDGLNVKVVNVDDVFDEFGFGTPTAAALHDFLQYAVENWQTAPRYVMLVGDATYDPRNYQGYGNFNFVPTQMVDTVYSTTGSDEALADFNNDGLAEIAIGRISVRTGADVTTLLNKTMAFENSLANVRSRGALCVSDYPNGFDFAGLCSRTLGELPDSIDKSFINRADPDSLTQVVSQINTGKYLVNYSGHGSTALWSGTGFFSNVEAAQLNNSGNQTLFTMLTCLNGYFLPPNIDSLAETLIKNPNGGAVMAWASAGLTTPDVQEIMARRFYSQIGNDTTSGRLGDFVRDAKAAIPGGRDVRLSWTVFGDPTLKVKPAPPTFTFKR